MPFRNQHSCMIDEDANEIVGTKSAQTKWGLIQIVMARKPDGSVVARSIRIPAKVPISIAQNLCRVRGGQFSPATPSNPKQQLMSEYQFGSLPPDFKVEILTGLIKDFVSPVEFVLGAPETKDLPDGYFVISSKRLLPYKDSSGRMNKVLVQNSLARLHEVKVSAGVKREALNKLIRIAHALGINAVDNLKFKLADLDYYLGLLEKEEASASS